jgi:hypothetical protein
MTHPPVIDVLYVQGCPNYRVALALVERVRDELGLRVKIRTTLIADQAGRRTGSVPWFPDHPS